MVEQNAFVGQPVDIRGPVDSVPVSTDGLVGMIVREHEQDVGPSVRRQAGGQPTAPQAQGQGQSASPHDVMLLFNVGLK
jgi:hypothetical protein